MTEIAKQPRGGRAFHSILAPHFEFIRQLRKQRKTWKETPNCCTGKKAFATRFTHPISSLSDAPVHIIVQALEQLQVLESLAAAGFRVRFFLFPSEETSICSSLPPTAPIALASALCERHA